MIGIILINYNNEDELLQYIKTELSQIKLKTIIVIIDNSCNPAGIKKIESSLSIKEIGKGINLEEKIFLIDAKTNLGYAKANNRGALFLKKYFNCDYILFSNTDIKFANRDVVEKLQQKMDEKACLAAINPMIIDEDLKYQTPMIERSVWTLYMIRLLFYPFARKVTPIISDAKEGEYYRLRGCFLLVRSSFFFNVGMFDENTFLYGEELILCERFRKIGKKSYYLPTVKVYHKESTTIKNFLSIKRRMILTAESELYYFKNYMGTSNLSIKLAYLSLNVFIYVHLPILKFIKWLQRTNATNYKNNQHNSPSTR